MVQRSDNLYCWVSVFFFTIYQRALLPVFDALEKHRVHDMPIYSHEMCVYLPECLPAYSTQFFFLFRMNDMCVAFSRWRLGRIVCTQLSSCSIHTVGALKIGGVWSQRSSSTSRLLSGVRRFEKRAYIRILKSNSMPDKTRVFKVSFSFSLSDARLCVWASLLFFFFFRNDSTDLVCCITRFRCEFYQK